MSSDPKKPHPGGLSRRDFLKSAGVTTAGGLVGGAGLVELAQAEETAARPTTHGPGPVELKLSVNGTQRTVRVVPAATLAEVLREDLDLTGTKIVCDRGECCACTVLLDGTPVCSCMTLAIDAVDRPIVTVEGLGSVERPHPVQAAFVECDAMQCGFCTPGMVMSCAALLERNPKPTPDDVTAAVSGNLCRCGTYPKVFQAALLAAGKKGGE